MTTAPYGAWASPISAADTVAGVVRFSDLVPDGEVLYWIEMRPEEGGRQVVVRCDPDGTLTDVTPVPHNARTRVHEYGGGAIAAGGGELVFSEFSDQRLYRLSAGKIDPLTAEPHRPAAVRFADGRVLGDGSVVCVRETHPAEGEPVNDLVRVDADGETTVIAAGRDFYAAPRPSPDGTRLAWLEWDHPNMPWDGTELMAAAIDGTEPTRVAGGPDESILQPEWRDDGVLFFCSDRRGWWNVYRHDDEGVVPVFEVDADAGDPAWAFGQSSFGFLSDGRLLVGFWEEAVHLDDPYRPSSEGPEFTYAASRAEPVRLFHCRVTAAHRHCALQRTLRPARHARADWRRRRQASVRRRVWTGPLLGGTDRGAKVLGCDASPE